MTTPDQLNRPLTTQEILQRSFNGETLALKFELGNRLPPSPDSAFNKYDINFSHYDTPGDFRFGLPRQAIYMDIDNGNAIVATLTIDYEQLSNDCIVIQSTRWT